MCYYKFCITFLLKFKGKRNSHKKTQILSYSNLNSVKPIIWKVIQACYISEKDYAFINIEVDRCNKLNKELEKRLKVN